MGDRTGPGAWQTQTRATEVGVVGPYPAGSESAIEVRAFFTQDQQSAEDPVTGSLNASLAQWLVVTGRLAVPYIASQGTALGRRGQIHVSADDEGAIWAGGATVTAIAGAVDLWLSRFAAAAICYLLLVLARRLSVIRCLGRPPGERIATSS